MFTAPKSKFVWQVKKYDVPVDLALSHLANREVNFPLKTNICVETFEPNSQDICESTLKPLSLASLVHFDEGTFLSKCSEARVDHLDNFILGESRLGDLGFISPIKVFKGTGSGYFLRSTSKVLMDSISSVGDGR